jgi:16S rRNA A1518/A1519 N6-dimethyltransferase RsmA/KsgA/DIM1 with predicted DNA glycosylase/AP lyase activity
LCFSQKRKTLANNQRRVAKPNAIRKALADLGLRVDARAEQLSITQFAAIFSQL